MFHSPLLTLLKHVEQKIVFETRRTRILEACRKHRNLVYIYSDVYIYIIVFFFDIHIYFGELSFMQFAGIAVDCGDVILLLIANILATRVNCNFLI